MPAVVPGKLIVAYEPIPKYLSDTTGAVVGGLAGLYYGQNSIPKEWIDKIARKKDIEELTNKLSDKYKIARC